MADTNLSCYDVAKYLLSQQSEESGDLISNLKLQKLVYYAQGCYLGLYGVPLFPEPIEAWVHGPVIPVLYRAYKQYGAGAIPAPDGFDTSCFDLQQRELLDEVYAVFGQFSAWKLREMTHEEPTWKEAASTQGVITHKALQEYFQTRVHRD